MVPTEKARAYAESLGIPFLETSAKTATNIESAFLQVTTALIRARYEKAIHHNCYVDILSLIKLVSHLLLSLSCSRSLSRDVSVIIYTAMAVMCSCHVTTFQSKMQY